METQNVTGENLVSQRRTSRPFRARYQSKCHLCSNTIRVDSTVSFYGDKKVCHDTCIVIDMQKQKDGAKIVETNSKAIKVDISTRSRAALTVTDEKKHKETIICEIKDDEIFINVPYKQAIYVQKALGRMHFYEKGASVYPFKTVFLGLARANSYKFGTKIRKVPRKVIKEVEIPITEDILKKMLGTDRDIRFAVQSIDSSLPGEIAEGIISDLMASIKKRTNTLTRIEKVITEEIDESLQLTAIYEFDDIILKFEDDEAVKKLKVVQPLIDEVKAKIEAIQRWRSDGVPKKERDYICKGEFEPFDHQWVMYKVHEKLDNSANLSQMGTGKTFAVLMTIDKRLQNKEVKPATILIVCPTTVMANWQKEINRHTPHLTSEILQGSYNDRFSRFLELSVQSELKDAKVPDILIMNYESFAMKREETNNAGKEIEIPLSKLMKIIPWTMVVLDECHKIKNPAAKRTGNLLEAFVDVKYKIIMSGTINANKLVDVHMPFVFLNRAQHFNSIQNHRGGDKTALSFGELFGDFCDAYFSKAGWSWRPRIGTVDELRARFEEIGVRYEKDDCFTLPPKMYDLRVITMAPKQKELYDALQNQYVAELGDILDSGGRVTTLNILAMMTKLAEVANGWIFDNAGNAHVLPMNPKIDALIEILEDIDFTHSKIVLWSRFTKDLHLMNDAVKEMFKDDPDVEIQVIHGGEHCSECSSNKSMRAEQVREFNEKDTKLKIIIANTAVGSHGIDLTQADYEVFFSNSFVKTDRLQAEDRCHRIGMRDSLMIYDLVCKGTVDEAVLDALKSHKGMTVALLENLGVPPEGLGIEDGSAPVIIEHQRQNPMECHLAAFCMLGGVTIEEGRLFVKKNFGRDEWFPYQEKDCKQLMIAWGIKLDMISDIPKRGKGMAAVTYPSGNKHTIVFAGGLIYDPDLDEPMLHHKWMKRNLEVSAGVIDEVMLAREKVNV